MLTPNLISIFGKDPARTSACDWRWFAQNADREFRWRIAADFETPQAGRISLGELVWTVIVRRCGDALSCCRILGDPCDMRFDMDDAALGDCFLFIVRLHGTLDLPVHRSALAGGVDV